MARGRPVYVCRACGGQQPKWSGQCADCGAWNTLDEELGAVSSTSPRKARGGYAGTTTSRVQSAAEVDVDPIAHTPTGIGELDRALGGGLVPGAVTLIGGDPGIGKSTLLLQALTHLAGGAGIKPLYVTGEESLQQVIMRARRLSLDTSGLRLLAETDVERILTLAAREQPAVVVIDSVQTVFTDTLQSAPGSVAQVRESAAQLVRFAKETGTSLFLVGHVTKEGAIAGPRVLEHMVDAVLYFESGGDSRFRVVRAIKNRFGAANEIGIFAMTEKGLREVANPSAIFLSRQDEDVPGSVVLVTREGTRPLLVEVQALLDEAMASHPRRVTVGLDPNRLAMLLAILSRHGGVSAHHQDVFVNVVGGVRVSETGADLAVLLAVLSSLRGKPVARDTVVFGEVGLAGEIRPVPAGEERVRDARKHGFKRAIVPRANAPKRPIEGIEITPVTRLQQAMEQV